MVTGFYTALLGFMLAALVVRIAMRRLKYRVGIGDGGIADLGQAIRVHGNFAETVPVLVIMMALMELGLVQTWILHIFGSLIVISRVLHAIGMTSSPIRSKGRTYGIVITLSLLVTGSVVLGFMYIKSNF